MIKEGSIGTVVPGFTISVRDDGGEEASVDEVGRIWINSRSATVGYWCDRGATSELLRDGWLDSGDLARRDPDGYLWFFGRARQIIVHDGSNVSPKKSRILCPRPRHRRCRGRGYPRPFARRERQGIRHLGRWVGASHVPAAHRVLPPGGYRAPEGIVVLEELPLNPTGKVDRLALKQLAEDHRNPARPG